MFIKVNDMLLINLDNVDRIFFKMADRKYFKDLKTGKDKKAL